MATIATRNDLACDGGIGLEVIARDNPAAALLFGHQGVGNPSRVERLRTAIGDRLQRAGQVGLHQSGAGGERLPVGEERGNRTLPGDHGGRAGNRTGQCRVHHKALAGESNGGLHNPR